MKMEQVVQPTLGAPFQCNGPVDDCEPTIEFRSESGKMMPLRLRGERSGVRGRKRGLVRWARQGRCAALYREPLRPERRKEIRCQLISKQQKLGPAARP